MANETYKILIVDDEEMNLKLLSRFLSCDQYTIYPAGSGKEAIELAKQVTPDIVLLDVMMPELDGAETCRILKNTEVTNQIPVIMLTACTDMETRLRCLRAGANDFLAKPFDNVELQLRVNNLLEFKRHADTRKWNTLLEQGKVELQKKNADMEQFLYTVSHDLRAPLNVIGGYSQLVMQIYGKQLDEQCQSYLMEIVNSVHRMNNLISSMLKFTMMKNAKAKKEKINLSIIAQVIALELKMTEPDRKVTFEIEDGLIVKGDNILMRVVLENLIGNAWKYSSKKKESLIVFGKTICNKKLTYFVRDNGEGFEMLDPDKLFKPFQRASKEHEGHGIGLATVHRIIKHHNGNIWAEGNLDKGAIFYFTLPNLVVQK